MFTCLCICIEAEANTHLEVLYQDFHGVFRGINLTCTFLFFLPVEHGQEIQVTISWPGQAC